MENKITSIPLEDVPGSDHFEEFVSGWIVSSFFLSMVIVLLLYNFFPSVSTEWYLYIPIVVLAMGILPAMGVGLYFDVVSYKKIEKEVLRNER